MRTRIWFGLLFLCSAGATDAQAQNKIGHRLVAAEYGSAGNRLIEVDRTGKITWEHKPPSTAVIFHVLSNHNVLYAFGGSPTGVREVDRKGEVVWSYISQSPQVLGFERLPNGNILLGEQGPPKAVEVNREGGIVRSTPLHTSHEHFHQQVRNLHQLPNGNILAAHEGEGAVREVDRDGKVVWEYTGVPMTGEAIRLPNGNTVITCGTQKRVIEVTPDKKIAWEFGPADAPELNLTWVFSVQRLKNGNLVIGNFLRGQEGKGAHAFEVTRDKKVVWAWNDHQFVKSTTMVRAIEE